MEKQNLFDAIEQLNKEKKELVSSKKYKIGAAISLYGGDLRRLDFKHIIKNLKDKRAKRIIEKNFVYFENTFNHDIIITGTCTDKKIAVYTCITGGYDTVQIPLVYFDNVDYVIFTDDPKAFEKYKDQFIIRKISEKICKYGTILANRYVKLHPHELLQGYDYSIYLDGNVRVISDIRGFVNFCAIPAGIAMHRHRERNCIYKEAEVCKLLRRGNTDKIDAQIGKYRQEFFPENYGMSEASVIVSDLYNSTAAKLFNEWWTELIESGSLRDQLALPYILWKNGFSINDVGNLGYDVYKNYKIDIVRHK